MSATSTLYFLFKIQHTGLDEAFFPLKLPERLDVFEGKLIDDTNSSLNLVETKSYEEGLCTAVSVFILANFIFHALSLDPWVIM